MRKVITDALLKGLKPPSAGRTELSDLRCPGLEFRLSHAGARSFSFRFRDPKSGAVTRSTIGTYPDVTLAKAREAAEGMRRQVASGVNPVEHKRRQRTDAKTRTFQGLADRYLEEHARRHKRSAGADERNLRLHILPPWSKRRYDEIERRDVIELVEGMVKAGKPVQANRVQALISMVFSFAVDCDLVKANPCARLRKRGAETRGTRTLTDAELSLFWRRAVLAPVSHRLGAALRLVLLTGCRAGEASGMQRSELHALNEPTKAHWLIPEDRSKNGVAHLVPLSGAALSIVRTALGRLPANEDYLFPSPVNDGPITAHALAVAMARMPSKFESDEGKSWIADPPSPHDLRRTVATRIASLGFPAEDVSAVLNHVRRDVTGRHYDLYQRAAEKRRALDAWASFLNGLCQ